MNFHLFLRKNIKKNIILNFIYNHFIIYPTPININYLWSFGALAGITLVIQIITGIFLTFHYIPHIDYAFLSIEHIMRNVNNGWFIRYTHANGASIFFIIIYIHIAKALYYGSYLFPREFVWCSGVIIFLILMATAFLGYVLPWGQMSFWGATVITNFFSVIPYFGIIIVEWLWGGFSIGNATLTRFFSLHYLLPFFLISLMLLHILLLHNVGSNNPLGLDWANYIPFYPYFWLKDFFVFFIYLFFFSFLVFLYPNFLNHSDNYIPANSLVTPTHIVPEWYFLPFYAILRSIPDKFWGVAIMALSIIILFFIPFLDQTKIRSTKFRPIFEKFFWLFIINFIFLGWLGMQPMEYPYIFLGQCSIIYYFFFFIIIIPFCGIIEEILYTKNIEKVDIFINNYNFWKPIIFFFKYWTKKDYITFNKKKQIFEIKNKIKFKFLEKDLNYFDMEYDKIYKTFYESLGFSEDFTISDIIINYVKTLTKIWRPTYWYIIYTHYQKLFFLILKKIIWLDVQLKKKYKK